MGLRRRQFTREFKLQVLREWESGKRLAELSREHNVGSGTIVAWRKLHEQYGDQAFQGNGNDYSSEARIAELERTLGQLALENALLKRALTRLETLCKTDAESCGS